MSFIEHIDGCDSSCFLLEPLLDIQPLFTSLPDSNLYDGVIVTSIHSVDVFSFADSVWLGKPFYCVGESVATALRDKGVINICLVTPVAIELAQKIMTLCGSDNLRFLYLRGKDISFDIMNAVKNAGGNVDELICYEAIAVTKFSDEFVNAIKNHEVSAVTFFSKRTARVFWECVRVSNAQSDLKGIKALCISDGMVEYLNPVFGQNIVVSDTPDADGMLRIIRLFI